MSEQSASGALVLSDRVGTHSEGVCLLSAVIRQLFFSPQKWKIIIATNNNQLTTYKFMFTIRANFSDTVEVKTNIEAAREFFADIRNFIELMPGIESIHTDLKGVTHWKIYAEVPLVGTFSEKFAVELAENTEERMEWLPVAGETRNLLRYAADFLEKSANLTLVQFSQIVELRRNSARELHLLAGVAGEAMISREMSRRIGEMIKIFVNKAKNKLEK